MDVKPIGMFMCLQCALWTHSRTPEIDSSERNFHSQDIIQLFECNKQRLPEHHHYNVTEKPKRILNGMPLNWSDKDMQ